MPKESAEQEPLNEKESDDVPELERTTTVIKSSLKRYAAEFVGTFLFVFLGEFVRVQHIMKTLEVTK